MKKHGCFSPVVILTLFASCASAAPEWAVNVQAVYPNARYIAQRGEGRTRQEAETAALRSLSYYFESRVTSETADLYKSTEKDGVENTERRTEQNTIVQTQTRLAAVRYAEDPWYNRDAKEWQTVAYIDREEAWTVYEPQAKKAADALIALYDAAEKEGENFSRALRFDLTAAYGSGAEFTALRGFSQILHPQKARTLFAEADALRPTLEEKTYTARQNASVFIDCPGDFEGLLYQAAVSALGAAGFPVERRRGAASCVCAIRVDEGLQQLESGLMYYPSLTGTITGKTGAVFSFTVKPGRQGAINPDVAKRRAYTALAAALGEAFPGELNKKRESLAGN
ncbi:MAG: LPP20 family lipoprotein [Treponema sp.]|nr:LPP20 family lipoprotein [Treponema sp.]